MLVYFKLHGKNHVIKCYTWKNTRWLIKHKQSARIECKNNLFQPCVRSKQLRTIKTMICNDIFTSSRHKKVPSPANSVYSVFVVWAVFKLWWRKKTYLKRRPLFRSQVFKFSNFVATSKARIWLAICEFLWLLTNQNVWFVTFFALN